ncbi:Synaptic glycoprotein SC2 [Taphrina deformans PYCC 5710]|uniref:Synaptic glycoprotein SC2 n=1 Tax=Taphrina deformans (strain PYCC 5710 / ATCC 11124 / CBS 356.35 / IMI 108563 / JCM 9778 / NBRC 8474) TaxID=1097556 RepID=R4X8R9_TAPDE|nr:Synaptic glycoprotein SC2 [Taphrina deformans PYCC 5710]|eukprot:CCG82044.1 Synaptic glycoprotein SC2 [Taphrina deformans PYCC 5710]
MSDSMISVTLTPKGKKIASLPKNVSTFKGAPISEITSILAKKTNLSVHRFRITDSAGKVLNSSDTIATDIALQVKDLGPQISWRTVFIIEYLGPLIIHPLIFFMFRGPRSTAQWITLTMVTIHFLKREYETIFVHRFSSETMPFFNLFKNCAHYWLIGGAFLAGVTYSDWYSTETYSYPRYASFLFLFSELCNFKTHAILRDLRPAGTRERKIPRGFGFDLVSCPNYLFEILAWVAMSSVTNSWASWLFAVVGAVQMWFWSVKKHRRYKKEFPNYPKDRKILIPFVI